MTGFCCYYSELGEARPGSAAIDAEYHSGHYYLRTDLVLSGRGVRFLGLTTPDRGPWDGREVNRYKATKAAMERISRRYAVAYELLL